MEGQGRCSGTEGCNGGASGLGSVRWSRRGGLVSWGDTVWHNKVLLLEHDLVGLLADGAESAAGDLQAVLEAGSFQIVLLAQRLASLHTKQNR